VEDLSKDVFVVVVADTQKEQDLRPVLFDVFSSGFLSFESPNPLIGNLMEKP